MPYYGTKPLGNQVASGTEAGIICLGCHDDRRPGGITVDVERVVWDMDREDGDVLKAVADFLEEVESSCLRLTRHHATKKCVMMRRVFLGIVLALLLTPVAMRGLLSAEEPGPYPPFVLSVPQLGYGLFFAYGVDSGSCASPGFPTFGA